MADELRDLSKSQVFWRNVQRHTLGWTAFFVLFFLALGFADFPVWQLLGLALALAMYYGSVRTSSSVEAGDDYINKRVRALFGPRRDRVWYWGLATAEWFGYLGVLVFASQLAVEVFRA